LSTYVFFKPYVFTAKIIPQLWRPLTAFLITKPKFGILMDPYFCYQYGSGLERESARFTQPGDFFIYTAFCAAFIAVSIRCFAYLEYVWPRRLRACNSRGFCGRVLPLDGFGFRYTILNFRWSSSIEGGTFANVTQATAGGILNSYTFLPALTLSYAYTFAQDSPTRQVSFFIVNFDAKYLPFALLFMSFIVDGPDAAAAQLTGLLAAHLYDFLTRIWPTFGGGKNYIVTPNFVKRLFGGTVGVQNRGFGHVVQGQGRATGSAAGAPSAAAEIRNRWGSVGPGRRLGGE
jgi:Derlin-2/3